MSVKSKNLELKLTLITMGSIFAATRAAKLSTHTSRELARNAMTAAHDTAITRNCSASLHILESSRSKSHIDTNAMRKNDMTKAQRSSWGMGI